MRVPTAKQGFSITSSPPIISVHGGATMGWIFSCVQNEFLTFDYGLGFLEQLII